MWVAGASRNANPETVEFWQDSGGSRGILLCFSYIRKSCMYETPLESLAFININRGYVLSKTANACIRVT